MALEEFKGESKGVKVIWIKDSFVCDKERQCFFLLVGSEWSEKKFVWDNLGLIRDQPGQRFWVWSTTVVERVEIRLGFWVRDQPRLDADNYQRNALIILQEIGNSSTDLKARMCQRGQIDGLLLGRKVHHHGTVGGRAIAGIGTARRCRFDHLTDGGNLVQRVTRAKGEG